MTNSPRRLPPIAAACILAALAAPPAHAEARPPVRASPGAPRTATAIQAADKAHPAPGSLITVTPGRIALDANVYTSGHNAWLFPRGTTISGPGRIDAVTDGQALGASGMTLARVFTAPDNEHGFHVSARLARTQGPASYEKTGIYVRLLTHDPSSYPANAAPGIMRDAVAFEGQSAIEAGNLTGRVWGINVAAGPAAGADGYAVGGEFGAMSESGSDAGPLGTPTSKIAVHAVAYGTSSSTAALVVSGNGTTFQDGIVATREALAPGGHAFAVRPVSLPPAAPRTRTDDVAWIGRDGAAMFGGLTVQGTMRIVAPSTPASSDAPCDTGAMAWDKDYVYLCIAASTWKRAALSTW